jgi:hypothetical protein
MNAILRNIAEFALKKYKEPSTWIPIVAAIGVYLHQTFPPDLQNAIAGIFASIIGALFIALNEHAAASGGAAAPADRVLDAAKASGVSPAAGSAGRDVQAGNQSAARTASSELDPPGFNDNGPN